MPFQRSVPVKGGGTDACSICHKDDYGCHCGGTYHATHISMPPARGQQDPFADEYALRDSLNEAAFAYRRLSRPNTSDDNLPSSVPSRYTVSARPSREPLSRVRQTPLSSRPRSTSLPDRVLMPYQSRYDGMDGTTSRDSPKRQTIVVENNTNPRSEMASMHGGEASAQPTENHTRIPETGSPSAGLTNSYAAAKRSSVRKQTKHYPLLSPFLTWEQGFPATSQNKEASTVRGRIYKASQYPVIEKLLAVTHSKILILLLFTVFQLGGIMIAVAITLGVKDQPRKIRASTVIVGVLGAAGLGSPILCAWALWCSCDQSKIQDTFYQESEHERGLIPELPRTGQVVIPGALNEEEASQGRHSDPVYQNEVPSMIVDGASIFGNFGQEYGLEKHLSTQSPEPEWHDEMIQHMMAPSSSRRTSSGRPIPSSNVFPSAQASERRPDSGLSNRQILEPTPKALMHVEDVGLNNEADYQATNVREVRSDTVPQQQPDNLRNKTNKNPKPRPSPLEFPRTAPADPFQDRLTPPDSASLRSLDLPSPTSLHYPELHPDNIFGNQMCQPANLLTSQIFERSASPPLSEIALSSPATIHSNRSTASIAFSASSSLREEMTLKSVQAVRVSSLNLLACSRNYNLTCDSSQIWQRHRFGPDYDRAIEVSL